MSSSRPDLLVSIHDVGPRFEREIDCLAGRLTDWLGGPNFAMLVVPDHWDEAPLSQAPAYQRKLRSWADQGVEMFVHGWRHRDDTLHAGRLARFRGRHMTAGEGEFLGLDQAEARRRMQAGRAVVEQATGQQAAGFIAPAWLYGEGAHRALANEGFALAEDHLRVWQPGSGHVLARGPVITWASRSRARAASSIGFAALARTMLAPLPVVRIAVHPGDTGNVALMRSIERTITGFAARRTAGRYHDLIPAAV